MLLFLLCLGFETFTTAARYVGDEIAREAEEEAARAARRAAFSRSCFATIERQRAEILPTLREQMPWIEVPAAPRTAVKDTN